MNNPEDLPTHAMELVNIDGHTWDVFVQWPNGTIARPYMVAIHDVFSRKFLAHSTGRRTESAVETRLAFARLFERYGVPKSCLMDNGRAFASKWITGGAKSPFRFKIRDEEPLDLLTALGIKIHWAKPYRGQSKPIERMFRDFCDHIAKHPAFAGAYVGNNPDDYGSRAIPLDQFLAVVEVAFAQYNARLSGRGARSIDQVFADSYATAPIGKVTEAMRRLALPAVDHCPTDSKFGSVMLHGNRYWSEELAMISGERVTVRFDPDDLHAPIHVYSRDGRYLCSAPVIEATGFLDVAAAKETRAKIAAEQLLDAAQIAALAPSLPGSVD